MSGRMVVRSAAGGEGEEVVRVIRSGFEPEILGATIYGCSGIARYVERQIDLPFPIADTLYRVAVVDGRIVGTIELRRLPGTLVLNYLSVEAPYRSSGLGRHLLRFCVEELRGEGQKEMLLDVFSHNAPAREWYERLGFEDRGATAWMSLEIPRHGHDEPGVVSGHPQADAAQLEYGFSELTITTRAGAYRVGRLEERWFRIRTRDALEDGALAATLQCLDSRRRILALLPMREAAARSGLPHALASSNRMSVSLDRLARRLSLPGDLGEARPS